MDLRLIREELSHEFKSQYFEECGVESASEAAVTTRSIVSKPVRRTMRSKAMVMFKAEESYHSSKIANTRLGLGLRENIIRTKVSFAAFAG